MDKGAIHAQLGDLARHLGCDDISHISYSSSSSRVFSATVVYGVIAERFRTIAEWYNSVVKHQLKQTIGQ